MPFDLAHRSCHRSLHCNLSSGQNVLGIPATHIWHRASLITRFANHTPHLQSLPLKINTFTPMPPHSTNITGTTEEDHQQHHPGPPIRPKILSTAESMASVRSYSTATGNNVVPLRPAVMDYAWGIRGLDSRVARFALESGIIDEVDPDMPYAELWIGTHPKVRYFISSWIHMAYACFAV